MFGRARSGRTIPLADAAELRAIARRTRVFSACLAVGLLGLGAVSLALAADLRAPVSSYFARGADGVVVLDLSSSVATSKYERIARVLRSLAATNQRTGLVLFSDTAYEALPPGTKGSELRPLVRFFTYRAGRGRAGFLETPWTGSFRAGTAISYGLRLARHILSRDRLRPGSVLLVSDLADSPFDTSQLVQELGRYVQSPIDLRVVPLSASRRDQLLFEEALGEEAIVDPSELLANETVHERRTLVGAFPLALVAAAAALLALLAANEHLGGRLSWRSRAAS